MKKLNTSIRLKLLSLVALIIASLFIVNVAILFMHFSLIGQYKQINDNMVLEGKLPVLASDLYETYYEYSKNLGNKNKEAQYNAYHEALSDALRRLDQTIIASESRILYGGLKNSINRMVEICSEGLEAAANNDIITPREKYLEATSIHNFILQNSGKLVLKELEYVDQLQEEINATHRVSVILIIVFLALITAFSIIIGLTTVNKLATPLTSLSELAKKVAQGNLDEMAGKDLIERADEVGSLSQSFNAMVFEIKNKMEQLEDAKKNGGTKPQKSGEKKK